MILPSAAFGLSVLTANAHALYGWRNMRMIEIDRNWVWSSFKSELAAMRASRESLSPQHLGEVFVAPDQKVVQEAQCWPPAKSRTAKWKATWTREPHNKRNKSVTYRNKSNMILYWSLLKLYLQPFQLKGNSDKTYPCDATMQYWPAISAPQRPCKKAASSSVARSASATKNSLLCVRTKDKLKGTTGPPWCKPLLDSSMDQPRSCL